MVAKCLFLCVLRPSHPHKNPYAALRSTLFSFRQSLHLFSFLWTNVLIIKPHFCTRAMEYKNVGYRMQRCPVHSICYCCSVTKSCLTLCDPMTVAHQGFLSINNNQSLLKLMSIESVMPSNHLILCCPLLLLPSIFPSISVFFNELALHIRWSKYRSFSFSISCSKEYSGLISLKIYWFDLLAFQGTRLLKWLATRV